MSSALGQLYQQIILDHARSRHGFGLAAPEAGEQAGESHQLNPTCGDEITLRASLRSEAVSRLSWEGAGCSISMASASVLTDLAAGLPREELLALIGAFREVMRPRGSAEADEELLGDAAAFTGGARYPARVKCAMLAGVAAEEALLAAK
ncbi:SUF system NifU family Fe-S cluster assembly protein [Arthrobacter deserti]|uniref:SUF system NifU family Fe-S cluster assembly protein n=1 Tax=Arthrobacter deserti TaxID=1742687 RepID=A0ABX1JL26_9MICC|nr:SUF system NifU family Fe-S cluster assembly protein [Arthrobacter deserti]